MNKFMTATEARRKFELDKELEDALKDMKSGKLHKDTVGWNLFRSKISNA